MVEAQLALPGEPVIRAQGPNRPVALGVPRAERETQQEAPHRQGNRGDPSGAAGTPRPRMVGTCGDATIRRPWVSSAGALCGAMRVATERLASRPAVRSSCRLPKEAHAPLARRVPIGTLGAPLRQRRAHPSGCGGSGGEVLGDGKARQRPGRAASRWGVNESVWDRRDLQGIRITSEPTSPFRREVANEQGPSAPPSHTPASGPRAFVREERELARLGGFVGGRGGGRIRRGRFLVHREAAP